MTIDAAVFKEQNVAVAVVVVQNHVLNNVSERDDVKASFQRYFPGCNIILMGQDNRGQPTYYGRSDITRFLSRIQMRRLPFKRYSFK
jgi:hypothetical protein